MTAVLLVASVVLLSWSVMFGQREPWIDRNDTRWLLALQLLLLMLATCTTNLWVGVALAWIAIHPWVVHLAFEFGPIPFAPTRSSTYEPLFPVLWWSVMYYLLTTINPSWRTIAIALIVWGLINVACVVWQDLGLPKPSYWRDERNSSYPKAPGLLGGSFLLAFYTTIGSFSSLMLTVLDHNYYALIPCAVLAAFSIHAGTLSPIFALLTTLCIYYFLISGSVWASLSLVLLSAAGVVVVNSFQHMGSVKSRAPGWRGAWSVGLHTWFIGVGLGMWCAISTNGHPREKDHKEGAVWINLHNDWLQSLVELGPIPALCTIGLLLTYWMRLTSLTSPQVYGLLLLTTLSLYAIVYFPMRDHGPALLVAISIALLK